MLFVIILHMYLLHVLQQYHYHEFLLQTLHQDSLHAQRKEKKEMEINH